MNMPAQTLVNKDERPNRPHPLKIFLPIQSQSVYNFA